MLIDNLLSKIGDSEKDREFANPVRMSSAGKCARAIAYQLHFPDKMRALSARARMVFRLGDTIEAELKELLRIYPPDNIELFIPKEQEEVKVVIAGQEVKGHIDGRAKINGEWYVLEVKSINAMRFRRVLKGEIDYGYIAQAHAYMKALGLQKTLFIYYNKDTSHVQEIVLHWDEKVWEGVEARLRSVIESKPDKLPEREYGPDKKGKLSWHCSYCSAVNLCWPDHEVQFDDKSKPQLIVAERAKDETDN